MNNIVKIKKGIDILLENYYNSTEKEGAAKLLGELKSDKDLQILYFCVGNLQNPPKLSPSDIEAYITENVTLCKQIDRKKLERYTNVLNGIELSELEKSINTVLFEERNAINFLEFNQSKKMVVENIEKKSKTLDEILEGYSVEDVTIAKQYASNPQNLLKSLCEECIGALDEKLNNKDLDTDTKLMIYQTKEKIYETQINSKADPRNVIDLLTLKNNLLNE